MYVTEAGSDLNYIPYLKDEKVRLVEASVGLLLTASICPDLNMCLRANQDTVQRGKQSLQANFPGRISIMEGGMSAPRLLRD